MKGLTQVPKPYISKILLENGKAEGAKQPGFTDLYFAQPGKPQVADNEKRIKLTFDIALKSLYPTLATGAGPCGNFKVEQVAQMLNDNVLWYKFVTTESALADFLLAENKLSHFITKIPGKIQTAETPESPTYTLKANDVSRFVYDEGGVDIVNMPLKAQLFYEHGTGTSATSAGATNPPFLACVFMYSSLTPTLNTSNVSFASEIIFRNGDIPSTSLWFTIDKNYRVNGEERPMRRSLPSANEAVSDDTYVLLKYGTPGSTWCGPIHRHYINGAYRYMAGVKHSQAPHPYLVPRQVPNTKIVDNRVIGQIANMFAYNSPNFEKTLAATTEVLNLSATNKKKTIDAYNSKPAIFSAANYSIKKIPSSIATGGAEKSRVNLLFAIDKLMLIKETSALAPLLDKLTMFDAAAAQFFVDKVNITNMQVFRVNKTTGQEALLLTSDNENYASDAGQTDYLGVSTSKGHILKKAANFKNKGDTPNTTYYEFRDGELDVKSYDDATYTYRIALRFEDPFVSYLSEKHSILQTVISNLDELIQRSNSKILLAGPQPDLSNPPQYGAQGATPVGNQSVPAFNTRLNKYNSQFLEKALSSESYFTFTMAGSIPALAQKEFSLGGQSLTPNSMLYAFVILNFQNESEPASSYNAAAGAGLLLGLAFFLKNSMSLTSTTPTLLIRAQTVLELLEDRMRKLLSLYSSAQQAKRSGNLTYTDYEKSNGNIFWKSGGGNNPGLVHLSHTFKEQLNLEKMRNHFDWLAHAGSGPENASQLVKMVEAPVYQQAVSHYARALYKDPNTTPMGQIETAGTPAFLPLVGTEGIDFFNLKSNPADANVTGFEKKVYQAMRRKVYTKTSGKGLPTSIPEVLGFFGVKFQLNTDADIAKILAQPGDPLKAAAVDNLFWVDESSTGGNYYQNEFYDDNFGISYAPVVAAPGGFNTKFGVDPSVVTQQNPFGSVFDPRYLWQGGPIGKYPLRTAKSILTLLFSDNLKNYRELDLFDVKKSPFFLGKKYTQAGQTGFPSLTAEIQNRAIQNPMALNLVAQIASAAKGNGSFDTSQLSPDTFGKLFDDLGQLRLENYPLYVLYLCLFGKVFYFNGYERASEQNGKTPTAQKFTSQIATQSWKLLTKEALTAIQPGDLLYCKVELCLDNKLIDSKFVKLFADFETYNQFFYLRGVLPGTPGLTLNTTGAPTPTTAESSAAIGTSLPPNLNGGNGLIIESL
jgi:hypothetical protein